MEFVFCGMFFVTCSLSSNILYFVMLLLSFVWGGGEEGEPVDVASSGNSFAFSDSQKTTTSMIFYVIITMFTRKHLPCHFFSVV